MTVAPVAIAMSCRLKNMGALIVPTSDPAAPRMSAMSAMGSQPSVSVVYVPTRYWRPEVVSRRI